MHSDFDAYLQGARNCLAYLGVKRNEQVLLLPTFEFYAKDPETITALRQTGEELGAKVSVAIIDALGTRGEPTAAIARAVKRSDVFIGIGDTTPNPITGHCLTALSARWDYGARQVDLRGGKGILATPASLFPTEIMLAIARHLYERLKAGGVLELSDRNGTSVRFPFEAEEVFFGGSFERDTFAAGQRCDWPLGQIMIHAEDGLEGVAMVNNIRGTRTLLERPVEYRIANGRVTMEARPETAEIIEKMQQPGNTNQISKLFLGLNPRGSITGGLLRSNVGTMAQAAGVAYLAIGDKAGHIASSFNTGGFLFWTDMSLNGEQLMREGRLTALDTQEVRAVASRYGNPDDLLAPTD